MRAKWLLSSCSTKKVSMALRLLHSYNSIIVCGPLQIHKSFEKAKNIQKDRVMVRYITKNVTRLLFFEQTFTSGVGAAIYCFVKTRQKRYCLLTGQCNGAYCQSDHEHARRVFQRLTDCQGLVAATKLLPHSLIKFFCRDMWKIMFF